MAATTATKRIQSDDRTVLSVIRNSDFVQREVAAQADAATRDRQALFDELAALDTAGAAERGAYEVEIGKARSVIRGVEEKMRAAVQTAVGIQSTHDVARFSRDARRGAIQAQLKDQANPIVSQFATWLLDEQDRCCRTPIEALQVGETRNPITGKRSSATVITNKCSIDRRLTAIREALRQLDDLRMLPDQREVPARIVEIKESFPVIEPPKAPIKEVAE
jgi:hypothetical protein